MKPSTIRWQRRGLFAASILGALLSVAGAGLLAAQDSAEDVDAIRYDPENPPIEHVLRLIDDAEIRSTFEKSLAKLMEDGKTGDAADIRRQLGTKRSCKVDLPIPTIGIPLLPEDVYGATRSSVLCLGSIYDCGKCEHWHPHLAGGVVLTEDGVAVTSYHVMAREDAAAYGAISDDGDVFPITEVLAASKANDLAIVRLDVESPIKGQLTGSRRRTDEDVAGGAFDDEVDLLTPAILSLDDSVGSQLWAISHPSGRFYSLSTGVLSRYYRKPAKNGEDRPIRMSITADFARGSSGCGVFNSFGKLSALVSSTQSIYYNKEEDGDPGNLQMVIKDCIPARAIKELIHEPEDEDPDEE